MNTEQATPADLLSRIRRAIEMARYWNHRKIGGRCYSPSAAALIRNRYMHVARRLRDEYADKGW